MAKKSGLTLYVLALSAQKTIFVTDRRITESYSPS